MMFVRKVLFALVALTFVDSTADAGWRRQRRVERSWQPAQVTERYVEVTITAEPATAAEKECEDALDEVNACRERAGLRPFLRDRLLCRAAHNCARFRAERLMEGHTIDDFNALPAGASAKAAGCAAWPQHMGFGACCVYESWTYAGAAWVIGRDGRRYCHLFVR